MQLGSAHKSGVILGNGGQSTSENEENNSIYKYKDQLLILVLTLVFNRYGHVLEFNYLHSSPSIIRVIKSRRMKWVGQVASMGDSRVGSGILVEKPEGKRPFGRPRDDNIKMDLQEVRFGGMNVIDLVQGRDRWRVLVNAVMDLGVP